MVASSVSTVDPPSAQQSNRTGHPGQTLAVNTWPGRSPLNEWRVEKARCPTAWGVLRNRADKSVCPTPGHGSSCLSVARTLLSALSSPDAGVFQHAPCCGKRGIRKRVIRAGNVPTASCGAPRRGAALCAEATSSVLAPGSSLMPSPPPRDMGPPPHTLGRKPELCPLRTGTACAIREHPSERTL